MSPERHNVLSTICAAFGIKVDGHDFIPLGNGLIHQTFLIKAHHGKSDWVLQQVNTGVFTRPELIAYNNYLAAEHLRAHHPEYRFMSGLRTIEGRDLFLHDELGTWRVFPYFQNTVSCDGAVTEEQAYGAAQQYGLLTRNLGGVNIGAFRQTIPGFHDLALRFEAFERSINGSAPLPKASATDVVKFYMAHAFIVEEYKVAMADPGIRTRITHNDTKVSNVLFDKDTNDAVCVVDLDTLMPGKAIFDLGDMIRSFISPAAEDDPDPAHAVVNEAIYEKLIEGYFTEMAPLMSLSERALVHWCGQMLIYEQGIRFLTDHLRGDLYYRTQRPDHNLDRAKNQMHLLTAYMAKKQALDERVKHLLN